MQMDKKVWAGQRVTDGSGGFMWRETVTFWGDLGYAVDAPLGAGSYLAWWIHFKARLES